MSDQLKGACVFSKIDLQSCYYQTWVKSLDTPETAFRTRYDHYEFLVIPFGVTSALDVFMDYMNWIFQPYLDKFVVILIDNILIYAYTSQEHGDHLRIFLLVLQESKYFPSLASVNYGWLKCNFLVMSYCKEEYRSI